MSTSELINEILLEWSYRVDDGMPNPKNPKHIAELSLVLTEMGLGSVKGQLIESLLEADKQFSNPVLNKEIPYKAKDGSTKKGIVGNLLRMPKDSEGRKAAEKMLPADSAGKDAAMKDLGSEKDGKSTTPEKPKDKEDEKDKGDGKEKGGEQDKAKAAQAMFSDPSYKSARLDTEKAALAKIAQDDVDKGTDGGTFGTGDKEKPKEEDPNFKPVQPDEVAKQMPDADPSAFSNDSDIENISSQERNSISTKIDDLAKMADEAKAKGEKAPNYNLCDVAVPGTNLYCDNNLGIPREEMPQFKGKPQPGSAADSMPKDKNGEVDTEEVFKKMLKDKGIKTMDTEIPSDGLKASQSELVGAKVAGMTKALEQDPMNKSITAPIYVSRDGYVIDGHHRWAAMTSKAIKDGKPANMKVHVIDMDAKDIIPMANKFAENIGVAAKKADTGGETIPQHKDTDQEKKAITSRIQDKIKGWADEEKEFFKKKVYKGNSPERRSWGEAIKAKGIGAWHAILKGAKHEVEEFKTAGLAVKDLVSGKKLDHHQKQALKAVGIKIATTALFGGLTGGLHHGASKFALHVAQELIPHTVSETILKGIGKASLFAGAEEEDMYMEKFLDAISQKMAEQNITPEMMEQMIDSFNEKDKGTNENVSFMKKLVTESVIQLINEVMDEAEAKKGQSKDHPGYFHRGGGYYSTSADGEITHKSEKGKSGLSMLNKDEKDKINKDAGISKPAQNEPVAGAGLFGQDYKDARGGTAKSEPTQSVIKDNGPAVTAEISHDEDPETEKGAKEINVNKFNSKKFTQSTITQEQAFSNVEAAYPKIKKHDYVYPNGSDKYLKTVMHPAAFEAMDTLIKLSKGGDFVPPISMITNQYGAGKISAQMNELCMQAAMAFPNTNEGIAARNSFIESLRENNKTIVKSGQKPILDDTWIDEFAGASDAFNGALDRQYGKGNWKAIGTTWDVRSQNEDRGINYNDKGFSTDINIQIQAKGKMENVEISCKKDWKIFLLNAGLGDASNWYYTLGPEKEKRATELMQRAAAKIKLSKQEVAELKELSQQALSKAPVSNKSLQSDQYKSAIAGAKVIDGIEPKELTRIYKEWIAGEYDGGVDKKGKVKSVNDPDFTKAAIAAHMKVGITNEKEFHAEMKKLIPDYKGSDKYYKKAVVCIGNMLNQTKTDDDAANWYSSHMGITRKFVENAAQTLVKNKEYRKMLLRKLQESIPIKTLTQGVETMQIDSMYITKEHMGSLFGTNDWADIKQYLDVQVINGEGVLVYKAKGKIPSKPISIAKIGIREKGTGYDGNPALEVKPSTQFESEMRRITKELEKR